MTLLQNKNIRDPLSPTDWKLVLILATVNLTHILDFVIVMPLGDRLRHDLGITPQQFGFVVSAYGIAAMLSGLLAAFAIDRFDRKATMLLTFGGFTLMTFYCGFAPNYAHLLIARSLAGVCGGLVSSTIMAFIVDSIADHKRGRAIGVVTSSFAFASTIGLPIGLALANYFDRFGASFVAIAILSCFVWLLCWFALPSLRGHMRDDRPLYWKQMHSVFRQRNHQWSFLFMLAMVFGTFMIVPYIAPYFQANCGMSAENLPWVYLYGGIGSLVSMNLAGWLTDRLGARMIFLLAAGSTILMTLVVTNLPAIGFWGSVGVAAAFMSFATSRVVPAQTMMLQAADPSLRGAFTSINTAVSHLATGTAPLITGMIVGETFPGGPLTHYPIAGIVAASFGLTAMGLSFFLRPWKKDRLGDSSQTAA